MKVIRWNMRGLARQKSKDFLRELKSKHNPDILILAEPLNFAKPRLIKIWVLQI